MNPTEQFIEDAVAGGWRWRHTYQTVTSAPTPIEFSETVEVPVDGILLDPHAWQAVGKTRGWDKEYPTGTRKNRGMTLIAESRAEVWQENWYFQWNVFIDHLADGKTIDEALAAIT